MLVTAEFCIEQKGRESKHHGALLVHFLLIDYSKKIFEILIHPYGMPWGYVDLCKTLEVKNKLGLSCAKLRIVELKFEDDKILLLNKNFG